MKNLLISLSISSVCLVSYGQNTNYGTNAGNSGSYNSAFGYSALDNVTGNSNTASGAYSLFANTKGDKNTALGYRSLYRNTSGSYNTAIGVSALLTNATGSHNTASGSWALLKNITGSYNTAYGMSALYSNTSGSYNTSSGFQSMDKNTTGSRNTANGYQSLNNNITGPNNTASGYQSLYNNTYGSGNTASGRWSLYRNTVGNSNTASGAESLASNSQGNENTAMGYKSSSSNTIGNGNTSFGYFSLAGNTTGEDNTAVGSHAGGSTTGFGNTVVGSGSSPTSGLFNNTTILGYASTTTASNSVRIGNTSVVSIGGQVGWTVISDGRFKKEVQEDLPGLEFITQLRPVSYVIDKTKLNDFLGKTLSKYNEETPTEEKRESGFIAQEVEEIVQKSGYTFSGVDELQNENDIYGIRYSMFVVPLVKAVQELNDKVDMQNQTIEELKNIVKTQQEGINAMLRKGQVKMNNETTTSELFSIYPNPLNEEATINMMLTNTVKNAKIIIYTLDGKELNSFPVNSRGKTSIQISKGQLQPGTYLYTLITDGSIIDTKRMILAK